jgi:hypothetical protein
VLLYCCTACRVTCVATLTAALVANLTLCIHDCAAVLHPTHVLLCCFTAALLYCSQGQMCRYLDCSRGCKFNTVHSRLCCCTSPNTCTAVLIYCCTAVLLAGSDVSLP